MDRQYDFILNELNRYLGCSCSFSKNSHFSIHVEDSWCNELDKVLVTFPLSL